MTPEEPGKDLERLIAEEDEQGATALLESLPAAEASLAIDRLHDEDQEKLMVLVAPEMAAELLDQMPDAEAADIVDGMDPRQAADIIQEMSSDAAADLLGDLDAAEAEAILLEMDLPEAADARGLLAYDENTAGGIMRSERMAFERFATVHDVIEDLRAHAETYSDFDVQYAYIIEKDGRLCGVLRMRDLLLSRPHTPVTDIMIPQPMFAHHSMSRDALVQLFNEKDFIGLPVVDDDQRLVGVVLRESIDDAEAEAAAEDFLKVSGLGGREELRSMPLRVRSGRRLSWLSINILLNVLAAGVIAAFQDTLSQVIALAVFLPIISDMSGCSGSQAVAVSIRELTLGLIRPTELVRVLGKELALGLVNGLVLGFLIAGVALLWKGNPWLGLVVGAALMVNTVVAVCLGGAIPLVLKRFDFDPALASGPILTTITDMCGFFFVLGLATILITRLT